MHDNNNEIELRFPNSLNLPDSRDPFYDVMHPRWDKIRTILKGTQAMRDAGTKYTPKFEEETDAVYKRRLQKTHLTNVTADSVENAVSKVFSKPLSIDSANSLDEYTNWSEDIDRSGNNLNEFAEECFYDTIADGVGYILADNPPENGGDLSIEQKRQLGLRPYLIFIDACSMLSFRYGKRKGSRVPVYMRYILSDYRYDDRQTPIEIKTVHEIQAGDEGELGFFRTYSQEKGGQWVVENQGNYPFDQVTCVRVCFGKNHERNREVITPPFLDLAETNIAHWNSQSDQINILEHSRFAMYHFKGVDRPVDENGAPAAVSFGPNSVFFSAPGTDSAIDTTTLPVDGLVQGWTDLDRKIDEMKMMGLDPLTPSNSGALTASERVLDEAKSNSALQNWAIRFGKSIELAFQYMGLWENLKNPTRVSINVNTEFGVTEKEINEIRFLREMQSLGQLSLQTLLEETKNRQVFDETFDTIKELERIAEEQAILHEFQNGEDGPPDDPIDDNDADDNEKHKASIKFPKTAEAA